MFLGHFGVALAAKSARPRVSLGVLVLAAQFADLIWPMFLLLGWEQVRIVPENSPFTRLDFISYPYSHSLVAQLLWAVVLGTACWVILRDARSAAVIALCVPTHWVLDYIAHRPDMPIVPGGARYGLGMWNSVPRTLGVESGLFAAGVWVYRQGTRADDRVGHHGFWSLVIALAAIYFGSVFGPPPPNARVLAMSALSLWLLVPCFAWADRHRSASHPR